MQNTLNSNKKIMVSGIQPSNKLTLGNYIGSVKPFIQLQNEYKMFVFVADLHAITNNFDPKALFDNRKSLVCMYKACGLDFKKCCVFYQSEVVSHNDISHVLLCHTTIGELSRMTQFKDKGSIKNENNTTQVKTGLLTYPALMAADILLYDANVVIVGQDQKQHMELTRDLAIRMNNKYGSKDKPLFVIPEAMILKNGAKIMDLQNPSIKMSKSTINPKGVIYLLDDQKTIKEKIAKAVTDNFNKVKHDKVNQPGVSNLIEIYSSLSGLTIEQIEQKYKNIENYLVFKKELAELVANELSNIQNGYLKAQKNYDSELKIQLSKNADVCTKIVKNKTSLVYSKIGLEECRG